MDSEELILAMLAVCEATDDPEARRKALAHLVEQAGGAAPPVEMALEGGTASGPDSASALVDAILARGAAAGVEVAEEVKEAVRAVVKKKARPGS